MASASQLGAETRAKILPSTDTKGLGFLGPSYDYSDELVPPAALGVRREGSMGAVIAGVKGVGYYVDTIGFGESSNPLTRGMPFIHYGVNYFLKTGAQCSNGADAWSYMEMIPKGDAFGENVQKAIAGIGVAQLRGLAPGIIEDAKAAMNPAPLFKSLFGSGYPVCKKVTRLVGDELGRIADAKGNYWVDQPSTVFWQGGKAYQTKWVVDRMVDKEEYDSEEATLNPDGTPIQEKPAEGFEGNKGLSVTSLAFIAAILAIGNIWAWPRR
jgi:hypothetical protein